jgi:hypothetical protein
MTAAAFMVMIMMFMVVTTAAFMVVFMMLVVMTAAAFMVMIMMFMVVTTAALVAMGSMTGMVFLMGMLLCRALCISGINYHAAFHCPGDLNQFRNQGIGVFRSQAQLLGGKRNDCFLYRFMIVEFLLDLGSTVGTVQIVNDIYLSGHPNPS